MHVLRLSGSLFMTDAEDCVQGLHTAKVKSKRALLVEEGVQFAGTKIRPSCVLDVDDLLAALRVECSDA